MSIRSMLVPLTSNTERESAALEAAMALANREQAHLEALYLQENPTAAFRSLSNFGPNGRSIAQAYEAIKERIAENCATAHRIFLDLCRRHDIRAVDPVNNSTGFGAVWREVDRDHQRALAALGQMSDLIVVGRPEPTEERSLLEAVLRGTGRPVLMVPSWSGKLPGAKVAIAWNGSTEAARALAAAMPFLETADRVTVLTAESEHTPATAAETARTYLARHGISAETRVFSKALNPPVGRALLDHCRGLEADLLVMGAYSHSRAHEMLLGGVTAHMAAHADRPVLMAH